MNTATRLSVLASLTFAFGAVVGCSTGEDDARSSASAIEAQPAEQANNGGNACFASCIASDPAATAIDQAYLQCASGCGEQNDQCWEGCEATFWSSVESASPATQQLMNQCGEQCFGGQGGNGGGQNGDWGNGGGQNDLGNRR